MYLSFLFCTRDFFCHKLLFIFSPLLAIVFVLSWPTYDFILEYQSLVLWYIPWSLVGCNERTWANTNVVQPFEPMLQIVKNKFKSLLSEMISTYITYITSGLSYPVKGQWIQEGDF